MPSRGSPGPWRRRPAFAPRAASTRDWPGPASSIGYAENDARSRVEVAVFFRLYLTLREKEAADAMVTVAS